MASALITNMGGPDPVAVTGSMELPLNIPGTPNTDGHTTVALLKDYAFNSEPLPDNTEIVIGAGTRTIFGGAMVLNRELDNTLSGSPHGFDENSTVNRTGNVGMAAFDARTIYEGAESYDHYVAFQHDSVHGSSGDTTNLITLASVPSASNGGSITNRFGVSIEEIELSGGATVVNNHGIHVQALTAGENNWAIYTVGSTPSFLGGKLTIGTVGSQPGGQVFGRLSVSTGAAQQVSLGGAFPNGEGGVYIAGDGAGYSEIQAMLEGTGFTPLVLQRRGGNCGIGVSDPDEKLDVGGNIKGTQIELGTDGIIMTDTGDASRRRITVNNGSLVVSAPL